VIKTKAETVLAGTFFTPAQTEEVVARSDKSFQSFRTLSAYKRAQLFSNLAGVLRKKRRNSPR
jgi:hypothetical protein